MCEMIKYFKISLVLALTILILFNASCGNNDESYAKTTISQADVYILNVRSKKIHKYTCGTAELIYRENRREYFGDIDELYDEGYTTCGNCFR